MANRLEAMHETRVFTRRLVPARRHAVAPVCCVPVSVRPSVRLSQARYFIETFERISAKATLSLRIVGKELGYLQK